MGVFICSDGCGGAGKGEETSFQLRSTPAPSLRESGCREPWPHKPHPTRLNAALPTLDGDSTPFVGRGSRSKVLSKVLSA